MHRSGSHLQHHRVRPVTKPASSSLPRRNSRTAHQTAPAHIPASASRLSVRVTVSRPSGCIARPTPVPPAFASSGAGLPAGLLAGTRVPSKSNRPAYAVRRDGISTSRNKSLQGAIVTPESFKLLSDDAFKVDSDDHDYDDSDDVDNFFLIAARSQLSNTTRPALMPALCDGPNTRRPVICTLPSQPDGYEVISDTASRFRLSLPAFGPMEEDKQPEGLWYYFLSRESVTEYDAGPVAEYKAASVPESYSLVADSLAETVAHDTQRTPRLSCR
ncbi:hypothetical protein OE88DRAFT_1657653 [Heliocybe sulcata]|uniref:Uncharacterized protein n=1 Tax=Heliocybe sulcata TaxID=5364 RepID=A0A5C3NFU9_9AGAM|nr:hypothetical protein OE88DRAFT_1657653 [Heliocybe sulcata]